MAQINFLDLDKNSAEYKHAKVVILPVPYESSMSYGKGASKGPESIIKASTQIEYYDEEVGNEPWKAGIYTAPSLKVGKDDIENTNLLHKECKKYIQDGKFLINIGGDHSISFAFLKALKEKYKDISVLQLDAHSDLRDEWNDSKYNHACGMRRILEHANAVQVGIRSQCSEEVEFIKKNESKTKIFYAMDLLQNNRWMEEAVKRLSNNVFITIDLDVFDPSIIPAVGTPEPGGLHWYKVIQLLKLVFKHKNVVGCDVVELSPIKGLIHADFTAAKLVHKLIAFKYFLK